jgi:hypothetical protein
MSSPTRLVCAPLPEMEGSVHLVEFGDASFNAVLGCTHGWPRAPADWPLAWSRGDGSLRRLNERGTVAARRLEVRLDRVPHAVRDEVDLRRRA